MAKNSSYSAVIIEYFSGDHLFKCLDSLLAQTLQAKEIIVINNGASDESISKLEKYDKVQVVNPAANLGYARAANLGIANTTADIVATLNPDIVLDRDCAELLVGYLDENEKVGAVGPLIREPDGFIYPSARIEPGLKVAIGHAIFSLINRDNKFTRKYQNVDIDKQNPTKVDWLSGAAMFVTRDALNKVGMWDERYFMYCEDIDLCNSLRGNGFDIAFQPQAKITHVGGGSSGNANIKLLFIHHKSLYLFACKKYKNQPLMKILALIFIGIRFPFAVIKSKIR